VTPDVEDLSTGGVEQEHHLDGDPAKVWRAISLTELREVWLPDQVVIDV